MDLFSFGLATNTRYEGQYGLLFVSWSYPRDFRHKKYWFFSGRIKMPYKKGSGWSFEFILFGLSINYISPNDHFRETRYYTKN